MDRRREARTSHESIVRRKWFCDSSAHILTVTENECTYNYYYLSVQLCQGHRVSLLFNGVSTYTHVPHDTYLYCTEREHITAAQGANTLHPPPAAGRQHESLCRLSRRDMLKQS